MIHKTQFITALLTVASAGIALGCGCGYTSLQPVREVIVSRPICYTQTTDWGAPFRAVGTVVSAPFVALGSAFSPRYVEPVGERIIYTRPMYETRWVSRPATLMPVGERFTTVKIIRTRTLLEPVGERFILKKHCYTTLKPVGERFLIVKHHKMLRPVGERIIIEKRYHKTMLKPVGEKLTFHKKTMLKPVGESKTLKSSKQWTQTK